MPAATELQLPHFDHTDTALRGERYREAFGVPPSVTLRR